MAKSEVPKVELPTSRPSPRGRRHPAGGAEPARGLGDAETSFRASSASSRSVTLRLAAEVERLSRELAEARARLIELEAHAERDPLTDVLNRRGFGRELARSLAYVRRHGIGIALVYVDLDGFKPVNDRHGHAAGDVVLRQVAGALSHAVRASDVVARLGGDEFAVLLWNITAAHAEAKAVMLEQAIAEAAIGLGDAGGRVGASAGMTMLAVDDDPDGVLARADAAMYARKAARRAG